MNNWKIAASHLPHLLADGDPWYQFARAPNLEQWRQHLVTKSIPHVLVEMQVESGKKVQALWIRYRYDAGMGVDGLPAEYQRAVKAQKRPACVRILTREAT